MQAFSMKPVSLSEQLFFCKRNSLHNFSTNIISELDALGDELLADEDNSYLDEAASAPAIPEVTPTDTKNKVSPIPL